MNKKVLLALSGGVDSAVAALLLRERGFEVVGAFMKMWSDTKDLRGECAWKSERRDAAAVAARLGIPIVTLDFEADYRREVMEKFFAAYAAGETPNPDLLCNSRIKFPLLRVEAERLGFDLIATGHYAKVVAREGAWHLFEAEDKGKDQTYFLAGLMQADLARTIFPIGEFRKPAVREMARRVGLAVADKRSTRGICFVGKVDLPEFLRQKLPDSPGPIKTIAGLTVGEHRGLHRYTIGQRHGFGVSSETPLGAAGGGEPFYVVRKESATNTLVVSADEHDLLASVARLRNFSWIAGAPKPDAPLFARPRYRASLSPCYLEGKVVRFAAPERALTPGQTVVFYSAGECLGGAEIEASE